MMPKNTKDFIIPDGAYYSGLAKDYGGQYNPDYIDPEQRFRLQNDREWKTKVDYQKQIVSRYHAALESIAKNTCCDNCREAALVAQAALDADGGTFAEVVT